MLIPSRRMSGARRIIQINEKFPAGRKSGLLNASGMAMLQGKNPARPAAGTSSQNEQFQLSRKWHSPHFKNPPAYEGPHKVHEGNYI